MKRFSQSLQQEMERRLGALQNFDHDPLAHSVQAVKLMVELLERLKTFCIQYEFDGPEEEILFFREIKPRFASRLIYYNEIYNIEVSKPKGAGKWQRRHYKSEMAKLKSFFADHLEFYRYYRSGDTESDARFFVRRRPQPGVTLDSAYFQADHRFCTSHDYQLARLMACEEVSAYLEQRLRGWGSQKVVTRPATAANWTASKVALVELLYALHAEGVFNNGNLPLKDIVTLFEQLLNVSLGQYHKTFLEIRERRTDRARFLSSLHTTLINRMETTDEL